MENETAIKFVVVYQEHVATGNQQYVCMADNEDHARELCQQAHPQATIHRAYPAEW